MGIHPLKTILIRQSLFASIVPFLIAAALSTTWLYLQSKKDIEAFQHQVAANIASQVESYLSSALITVKSIAAISFDDDLQRHDLQHVLDAQIKSARILKTVYAVSFSGTVVGIGLPEKERRRLKDLIGIDLYYNSLFREVLKGRRLQWSDSFLSAIGDGFSVALAVPGENMVVIGELELDRLTEFLKSLYLKEDHVVLLVDRHGQVIADRSGQYTAQQLNIANIPLVREGLKEKRPLSGDFTLNDQKMVGYLVHVPIIDWRILVGQSKQSAFGSVRKALKFVLLGLVLSFLISSWISLVLSRRLALRFENLTSHAHSVAAGEEVQQWPKSGITEFDALSDSLEQMASTIREREKELETLMSNLPGLVYRFSFDEARRMLLLSDGCEELIGYASGELLNDSKKCFNDLIHCEDRKAIWQQISRAVNQKKSYHITYRVVTAGGHVKWVSDHGRGRCDVQGRPDELEGFISDVTQSKSLEEQLLQAQKMEAIGVLAGGIAHDFNNLLSPILGYAEIVRDDLPKESPSMADLTQIIDGAHRAKQLVNQILTFSRKTEQERSPVKIHHIVNEALDLLRASLPSTIEIKRDIQKCGFVLADPVQIHQMIMNLCTNAYHAMHSKGGELAIEVKEVKIQSALTLSDEELPQGDYLILEVSDTGEGMDENTMSRIFEPYFTTKKEGEGTGLGLSLVHGIVKRHGGYIKVSSQQGQGTLFKIYFPIVPAETHLDESRSLETVPGGKERIMVVDDEKVIIEMFRKIFVSLGYEVVAVDDSTSALKLFEQNPVGIDLVICDMTMPGLNGAELSKKLLHIRQDLPIILCTGFSDLINEEKAKAIGIRRYIMKPVVKGELAQTVREVLDQGQAA